MSEEALKLSAYFGERDHSGGRLLAEALIDICGRHRVSTSVLLRGIEGFGVKHRLQSERLLTLSEDLPMLVVAIDTPPRIEAVLEEMREVSVAGVMTLERVLLLRGADVADALAGAPEAAKLTVYLGRGERAAGRPAHLAVVDCLRRHGLDGASVLLGLDGTLHGVRGRGRFFARNRQVPLAVLGVGEGGSVAGAAAELQQMPSSPSMTLERVEVRKRDGVTLAAPHAACGGPLLDSAGLAYWQKLVVYVSEAASHEGQPLYSALVRRLRAEGAAGATALRGQWGYHGERPPHGERFWSFRRHVPVLIVVLDTPTSMRRWLAIVDEMTHETGLVTSELVPAMRAVGPGIEHGGLRLAEEITR